MTGVQTCALPICTGSFDLSKLAINGALSAELHMDMTTGSDKTSMLMQLDLQTTSH